jgi:hypothetical protein
MDAAAETSTVSKLLNQVVLHCDESKPLRPAEDGSLKTRAE